MITANWFDLSGQKVGETLTFGTNDLEFAKLQAIAVTGLGVIEDGIDFWVLGDNVKRLVISNGK